MGRNSYPEMISFSSKFYYEQSLQALKIRGKPIDNVLEFTEVKDLDRVETVRNANQQEADLIMGRLLEMCDEEDPQSVAIITPFRDQVTLLSGIVSEHDRRENLLKKLKLAIFTFDSCQGEERDIIFYSMVANRSSDQLSYIFPKDIHGASEDEIDGKLKYQRLNVGFSRGKEKLVFILSKPLDEYSGSIGQAMKHYKAVLENAKVAPTQEDVDPSSPMEGVLLDWIKETGFFVANMDRLEVIPQFELGAYLKALNPSYSHPDYKVDFLIRLTGENSVRQCIVEYDGFEYHFTDKNRVTDYNWRSYLTDGDVERECILESYGYKMLRVNRFNIGRDPVDMLDKRLRALFEELQNSNEQPEAIANLQNTTDQNIKGLEEGTHKRCSKCGAIKPKANFYDANLKLKYGRNCDSCKKGGSGGHKKKRGRARKYWK
jgi:hypothetical protein